MTLLGMISSPVFFSFGICRLVPVWTVRRVVFFNSTFLSRLISWILFAIWTAVFTSYSYEICFLSAWDDSHDILREIGQRMESGSDSVLPGPTASRTVANVGLTHLYVICLVVYESVLSCNVFFILTFFFFRKVRHEKYLVFLSLYVFIFGG